ncbi:MAG TPA: 2,3,4,5-tetrahydropyridine-2,6-dicarboxylate N-succinyltransferase, partial [Steroidobacteraceae bacterium]|nr:2,3,4,5-tetrahydropyridine-2,6-dicarboxylate N-succinyltransferase [Steroidobacteraceae bacterium]
MSLRDRIEKAFESRASLSPASTPAQLAADIDECLELLASGRERVAEPDGSGGWQVNEWLKKAVLLHFRTHDSAVSAAGDFRWFDKLPLKHAGYDAARFRADGARIVPGAVVRAGAFVARDAVLMPSFVNVGAHVGEGTMVDTWATVGSCAQIGRNVHLSGGVGIGGVLEPLQANPVIIEDNCFVGARSEVAEGVIVREGSVLGMGVYLGQSTPIINRATGETLYGEVPPYSVVVSGNRP